jgi:GTP cyclohydrolase I
MSDESVTELTCLICGKGGFKNVMGHVFQVHHLNGSDYRKQTGYAGPLVTADHARQMAMLSNLKWNDPEVRERRTQGVKDSYSEELREQRSQDAKAQWSDPEIRELMERKIEAALEDPEIQERRRQALVEYFDRKELVPMSALRKQLYERAKSSCEVCGKSEEDELHATGKRLHLHHKNYDKTIPELEDVSLICQSCHMHLHGDGYKRDRFAMITRAVGELLRALRVNLQDENFVETPRRVAKYLLEHFLDPIEREDVYEEVQEATFPTDADSMVLVSDIRVYGMCPHHLLPVIYRVALAYIPSGRAIGLSKLARLAELCLCQPVLQESGTVFLADTLQSVLRTDHVGVVVEGQHMCMVVRGVKKEKARTITSAVRGIFRENPEARGEFLALLRKGEGEH